MQVLYSNRSTVPPLLRASWRLQLTSLILAPMAVVQWIVHRDEISDRLMERNTIFWIFAGGIFLALHFGAWVASLDETSLTHSLLFVTAHPLIIVVGMALVAKLMKNYRRPSKLEIIGACIGFTGAALALIDYGDQQGDRTVTIWGASFISAMFVVGYIVSGRILRKWMPIFIYVFPVTLIGALLLFPHRMLSSQIITNLAYLDGLKANIFGGFLLWH